MKRSSISILVLILVLCLVLFACSSGGEATGSIVEAPFINSEAQETKILKVHFIDVGQADAILIQGPEDENIVIDAGNNGDSDTVVNYIRKQGISELKAVIGTHPHEDHIGGLDAVIRSFNVKAVYLPKVVHTSDAFRDVLKAVSDSGIKVKTSAGGVSIPLTAMEALFIGPVGSEYDNLNNYSAVLKVTFGKTSFLFQGDAEKESEKDIMKSELSGKLKSDVLKVGHHGSSSSSTPEYLERVNPGYAVIMAGKGNDYGHPHQETMKLLGNMGIDIYRTDEQGTIVAESNGENIKFNVDSGSSQTIKNQPEQQLYTDSEGKGLIKGNINSKGEKIYHLPEGAYYDRTIPEKWFKTELEAQAAGFRPAGK